MTNLSSIAGGALWTLVAGLLMMTALTPVDVGVAPEAKRWAAGGCVEQFAVGDCEARLA